MTTKERPILFSGATINAILNSTKTQTRRVIKRKEWMEEVDGQLWGHDQHGDWHPIMDYCPYHNHMKLWVRETWRIEARELQRGKTAYMIDYAADPGTPTLTITDHPDAARYAVNDGKWRPSIFMPKWASRLTLEIISVKVEKSGIITLEDARAEGFGSPSDFTNYWNSLNEKRGYSWESETWLWVVEFRKA